MFLSIFERNMLNQYPIKPSIWLCHIDDIFMIWNDSEDKLKDFLAYINTVNPAVQFTHAHSFKSVNFLDVLPSQMMEPFQLTHIQSLQTHQYLHMNSCHPNHAKKLLRFRRRHVFCVSVVTQSQLSLGVMN